MKYRMLTHEELIPLEDDLKHFLIVNGVEGDTWAKLNRENPQKAEELVALFSDVVLQKVYEKIKFLEHRSEKSCLVFKFAENEIELISISNKGLGDLSTPEGIHDCFVNRSKELSVFKTTKKYSDVREMEIHRMLEQGCVLSNEAFWISLEKVL